MIDRLLKLLISIIFYAFYKVFIAIYMLFNESFPGTLVVLMYHSVKPEQRYKFEEHMEYLAKIGRAVPADATSSLSVCQHHIALTFDDGFQSVFYNALPILCDRKIPATIFVPTGDLGKKPGWVYDDKHEYFNEILLTKEQLKQLPDNLITVGSHCVTHPNLTNIDENDAYRELCDSKKTLEEIFKRKIKMLSLPFGAYNQRIIELSKKAGYERVILSEPTFPSTKTDMFLLGRIGITLDDWTIVYRLKLLGAYQWLPIAIYIKSAFKKLFLKA